MQLILQMPEFVTLFTAEKKVVFPAENKVAVDDVCIELAPGEGGLKVNVTADQTPVTLIRLRWQKTFPEGAHV